MRSVTCWFLHIPTESSQSINSDYFSIILLCVKLRSVVFFVKDQKPELRGTTLYEFEVITVITLGLFFYQEYSNF